MQHIFLTNNYFATLYRMEMRKVLKVRRKRKKKIQRMKKQKMKVKKGS